MSVLDELERLFPGYRAPERAAAWDAAKGQLPLGATVQGVVVARYPFAVFVDIDAGFPALLLVTRLRDAEQRACPYSDIERYPAVGSFVEARVCAWVDEKQQIGLTQLERESLLGAA